MAGIMGQTARGLTWKVNSNCFWVAKCTISTFFVSFRELSLESQPLDMQLWNAMFQSQPYMIGQL